MEKGRSNPSDYRVILPTKAVAVSPHKTEINDYISFFCRAATLPSPSNTIMRVTGQENVGITRPVITGRNFGSPVVFTFTERSDMLVYTTLKNWIDSTILNSSQEQLGPFADRNLRINYYNSITNTMTIQKLEPQFPEHIFDDTTPTDPNNQRGHRIVGEWELINAIPLAIEQTTLAIESADSALDFNVSIAYESFKYRKVNSRPLGSSD